MLIVVFSDFFLTIVAKMVLTIVLSKIHLKRGSKNGNQLKREVLNIFTILATDTFVIIRLESRLLLWNKHSLENVDTPGTDNEIRYPLKNANTYVCGLSRDDNNRAKATAVRGRESLEDSAFQYKQRESRTHQDVNNHKFQYFVVIELGSILQL
jgi:hypothetical protein